MICECGCPINLKPYKGGESTTDILYFAEMSLRVYIIVIIYIEVRYILIL